MMRLQLIRSKAICQVLEDLVSKYMTLSNCMIIVHTGVGLFFTLIIFNSLTLSVKRSWNPWSGILFTIDTANHGLSVACHA